MQLRNSVALQSKTCVDSCLKADAVPGNCVVGLGHGLQSQVIQEHFVPRQSDAHTLIFEPAGIKHGAAAKPFPQHPDISAWNCHYHKWSEHDAYQRRHHQIDNHHGKVLLDKTPPGPLGSANGRFVIDGYRLCIHARYLPKAARGEHRRPEFSRKGFSTLVRQMQATRPERRATAFISASRPMRSWWPCTHPHWHLAV